MDTITRQPCKAAETLLKLRLRLDTFAQRRATGEKLDDYDAMTEENIKGQIKVLEDHQQKIGWRG